MNNLLGPGGLNNLQEAMSGGEANPQVAGLMNMANNMFANMGQQGGGIDMGAMMQQMMGGMNQQQPQAPNQQENNVELSNDNEAEVQPEPQAEGHFDIGILMNNIMGMNMNSTINEVITENNLNEEGQGEYDILGLCVSELNLSELTVLLTGDMSPLNGKHTQIREKIKALLEKENNNHEELKKKIAQDFEKGFLYFNYEQNPDVQLHEGFLPSKVVYDVINRNYDSIMDIILRDYTADSNPQFGQAYAEVFKCFMGEMAYELSEGFVNGLNGLQIMIRKCSIDYIMKVTGGNEAMAGMADTLFGRTVWDKILSWCMEWKAKKEEGERGV